MQSTFDVGDAELGSVELRQKFHESCRSRATGGQIMRAPLVVKDSEFPIYQEAIVNETGAVDPNLGVMALFSSLNQVLRLGGSYELVY